MGISSAMIIICGFVHLIMGMIQLATSWNEIGNASMMLEDNGSGFRAAIDPVVSCATGS